MAGKKISSFSFKLVSKFQTIPNSPASEAFRSGMSIFGGAISEQPWSKHKVYARLFKIGKKHDADLTAVGDLALEVHEGEVFGFLGPNGGGKTPAALNKR